MSLKPAVIRACFVMCGTMAVTVLAASISPSFPSFLESSTCCRWCQEYPLDFRDGPKKGKEPVIALFIESAKGCSEFTGHEDYLASGITKKFPEMAKLTVIEPSLEIG